MVDVVVILNMHTYKNLISVFRFCYKSAIATHQLLKILKFRNFVDIFERNGIYFYPVELPLDNVFQQFLAKNVQK